MSIHRPPLVVVIPLFLGLAAVTAALAMPSGDAGGWRAGAIAVLHEFQAALRRGERDAARELVASSSRPYVDELPTPEACGDLVLLGAKRDQSRVELRVREPDGGGRPGAEGTFVVVRERGRWVVDLLETAGANRREIPLPGPSRRIVPAPARADDVEAVRRAMVREADWTRRQR